MFTSLSSISNLASQGLTKLGEAGTYVGEVVAPAIHEALQDSSDEGEPEEGDGLQQKAPASDGEWDDVAVLRRELADTEANLQTTTHHYQKMVRDREEEISRLCGGGSGAELEHLRTRMEEMMAEQRRSESQYLRELAVERELRTMAEAAARSNGAAAADRGGADLEVEELRSQLEAQKRVKLELQAARQAESEAWEAKLKDSKQAHEALTLKLSDVSEQQAALTRQLAVGEEEQAVLRQQLELKVKEADGWRLKLEGVRAEETTAAGEEASEELAGVRGEHQTALDARAVWDEERAALVDEKQALAAVVLGLEKSNAELSEMLAVKEKELLEAAAVGQGLQEDERATLEAEKLALAANLEGLEKSNAKLSEIVAAKEKELLEAAVLGQGLQGEEVVLEAALLSAEEKGRDLAAGAEAEELKTELHRQFSQFAIETESLQAKLQDSEGAKQLLQAEADGLRSQLEASRQATQEAELLKGQLDRAQLEVEEMRERLGASDSALKQAEEEQAGMEERLQQVEARAEGLRVQLDGSRQSLTEAEGQGLLLQQAQAEVEELRAQLQQSQQALSDGGSQGLLLQQALQQADSLRAQLLSSQQGAEEMRGSLDESERVQLEMRGSLDESERLQLEMRGRLDESERALLEAERQGVQLKEALLEIDDLGAQLQACNNRIAEAESARAVLHEEAEGTMAQLEEKAELQVQLREAQAMAEAARGQLEDQQLLTKAEMDAGRERLEELKELREQLREAQELAEGTKDMAEQAKRLAESNQEMKEHARRELAEMEALQQEAAAVKAELEVALAGQQQLEDKLEGAGGQQAKLQAELLDARELLDTRERALGEAEVLKQQMGAMQEEAEAMRLELEAKVSHERRLAAAQVAEVMSELKAAREESAELRVRVSQVQAGGQGLLQQAHAEAEAMRLELKTFESVKQQLEEALSELEALRAAAQESDGARSELQRMQADLAAKDRTAQQLRMVIDQMRAATRSGSDERESLLERASAAEAQRAELLSRIAGFEQEVSELQQAIDQGSGAMQEVTHLTQQLAAFKASELDVRQELGRTQLSQQGLQQQVHELRQRLEAAEADCAVAGSDRARAETALRNLQGVLGQMQSEKDAEVRMWQSKAKKAAEEVEHRVRGELEEKLSRIQYSLASKEAAASLLKQELEEQGGEIKQLRAALAEAAASAQRGTEDSLDRQLVANLIVRYISSKHDREVLSLMGRMLGLTEEQKQQVGLAKNGNGMVSGLMNALVGGASGIEDHRITTEEIKGDNLTDAWLNFLMAETEES